MAVQVHTNDSSALTDADLDELAVKRAATLAPDYPSLEATRARVRAELDRQAAAITRVGSGLAAA